MKVFAQNRRGGSGGKNNTQTNTTLTQLQQAIDQAVRNGLMTPQQVRSFNAAIRGTSTYQQ